MAATDKLEKFKKLLINLLPKGRLWKPQSQPTFDKYLEACAQELCRADDRVNQLLIEVDPSQTFEALDQWEKMLGLPDECTPENQDLNARRTQVVQKLTNIGGLSKQFFEFVGLQLGFDITVENRVNFLAGRSKAGDLLSNYWDRHFVAGSTCGMQLVEIGWLYYFNVEMPATASTHFVAGSVAGTPLRLFENELVQCTMKKLKPAHAGVTFTFN